MLIFQESIEAKHINLKQHVTPKSGEHNEVLANSYFAFKNSVNSKQFFE